MITKLSQIDNLAASDKQVLEVLSKVLLLLLVYFGACVIRREDQIELSASRVDSY